MSLTVLLPDARMGGAQNVLLRLADEFAVHQPVDFLCLAQAGELHKKHNGPAHFRFLVARERLGARDVLKAFRALSGFMREHPGTTLLATGTGTNLLACAARLRVRDGARLVIREACASKNSESRVLAWLKRRLYHMSDGMIGVSDGVTAELQALAGKRQPVASIPNPVDAPRLRALADAPDEVLARFLPPYLLTVGRLVPQKNTALLVEAFAAIAGDVPEHLVIIGGGPLEAELRRQIAAYGLASRVHLLGEVANPHPWYKRASAFALSSGWEGYPNVLIEAMAHGLRVIATDCEFGPSQILAQGKYGELVPVGDAKAMAMAIRSTLQGDTAPEVWDPAPFSAPAIASRYLAFMRTCQNEKQ